MSARVARIACIAAIVLLIALAIGLLARQRVSREDAWQQIKVSGVMRVAMDAAYPPFEWVDSEGVYHGLDAELARKLAERWGVEAGFVNVAFDGLYDALFVRKADLILSALPYDALMTRDVIYSQPYVAGGQVIVVPVAQQGIEMALHLSGRVVAVELGAEGHALLSRLNRDSGLAVEILALNDLTAAVAALQDGVAAALVCDRIDALALTATGQVRIAGDPLTVDPYVIAVRADSPALARELDAALVDFSSDGTLSQLEERWLVGETRK